MGIRDSIRNLFKSSSKEGLVPSFTLIGSDTQRELFTSQQQVSIQTLYDVVRKSPELLGTIQVVMQDIMADGWTFKGSDSAVATANKFAQRTNFFKIMGDAIFDMLITGDGFILKIGNETTVKQIAEDAILALGNKFELNKDIVIGEIINSIPKKTTKLQVLKSGTMTGIFDKFGNVDRWVQRVANEVCNYDPKDVVHISIMNLGGDIYGFTPVQPLLADVGTLLFAKDTASKVYENQGVPPIMFNLPDAGGEDDRNYQLLKKQLEDMKNKKNKMRSFITTGHITSEQIKMVGDDVMPSKDIIIHLTNLILFAWGVPPNRVPHFAGQAGKVMPKEAIDGYFKTIVYMQRCIEGYVNERLWTPEFNVTFEFSKAYRIDELREANINAILWDRNGETIEEGRERIGLPREIPTGDTLPIQMQHQQGTRFNQTQDNQMGTNREQQNLSPENIPPVDNKIKSSEMEKEYNLRYMIKEIMGDDNGNLKM